MKKVWIAPPLKMLGGVRGITIVAPMITKFLILRNRSLLEVTTIHDHQF